MPDALAVVKVGNSAWLLRRLTPSRAIAAMVGAVVIVDHAKAQAVGDEQHHIVRLRAPVLARKRPTPSDGLQDCRTEEERGAWRTPVRGKGRFGGAG